MATTIRIRRRGGGPLNPASDAILDEHNSVVERLRSFELVEDAASLFGSGADTAIVEIRLTYVDPTPQDLQAIGQIIAIAERTADDVCIETTENGA